MSGQINRILRSGGNVKMIMNEQMIKLSFYDMVEQIETELNAMYPEKDISFQNNFDVVSIKDRIMIPAVHLFTYFKTTFSNKLFNTSSLFKNALRSLFSESISS